MSMIAEYKQVDIVDGVPVYETVYREMTLEEEAEFERNNPEMPATDPTPEERIAALEEQNAMLVECLLEMSEIIYS